MTDTKFTIAQIDAGDHDGHLDEIVAAVLQRVAETATALNWRITLDGDTWDQETVTLAELGYAERITGLSYLIFDPLKYVDHLVALVTAHFKVIGGATLDEAVERAKKLTIPDLKDMISLYEVGAMGKDAGGTSTSS